MTAVPQQTALSHACGALAAALVGTAEYYRDTPESHGFTMVALVIETLLGLSDIHGSLMALGKLQEMVPTRPITYQGQNFVNLTLFAVAVGSASRSMLVPGHLDVSGLRRASRCCSACC